MNVHHTEHELLLLTVQLVVIIGAARVFGLMFRRLGQPQVCGEIAAGLILGPSLLGRVFPGVFAAVFDPNAAATFSVLSQIGLVLMMFLIGLEFDFAHLRRDGTVALWISAAGIACPFLLGLMVGRLIHSQLALSVNRINFSLFIATALSITAIPVLGRMMVELNINRTRIGSLTIAAAAVDDVSGWIILALVTAVVRSEFHPARAALIVAATIAYTVAMVAVVRPLVRRWVRAALALNHGDLSPNGLAIVLIFVFTSAAVTNAIGIFSVFGAFMMGAILFDEEAFRSAIERRLRDFVTVFLLPLFFTYTGLRTDVGAMLGGVSWQLCGVLLVTAIVGKVGGCAAAALVNGEALREASIIAVLMNTRGLMELIVINVGYDLGIIPSSVFFMLVVMAVVTTYMTVPVLHRLVKHSELEARWRASVAIP